MEGLIKTTVATAASTTDWLKVQGISIDGDVPANTEIKFALRISDGPWKRWADAAWGDLPTQDVTAESLGNEGNTRAELEGLVEADLGWLANQAVDFAIALSSDDGRTTPVFRSITLQGATGESRTSETLESDPIILTETGAAVEILKVAIDSATEGGGSVSLQASLKGEDDTWADYCPLEEIPSKFAKAIKLRATLSVTAVEGDDAVTLTGISITHRVDNVAIFAEDAGRLVTQTRDYLVPMRRAHLMVNRPVTEDSETRAYICLRSQPSVVKGEILGSGTGSPATFALAHPEGLAAHTLVVRVDGTPTADFSYSTAAGTVTITAPEGAVIDSDYEYGWEPETWVPMTRDMEYPNRDDPNMVSEQYGYLASGEDDPSGPIASFRLEIVQGTGTETEPVGVATGALQSFRLAHSPKPETIEVRQHEAEGAEGSLLAPSAWEFREDSRTLLVTGPEGKLLSVKYDWVGDTPRIDEYMAVLNR